MLLSRVRRGPRLFTCLVRDGEAYAKLDARPGGRTLMVPLGAIGDFASPEHFFGRMCKFMPYLPFLEAPLPLAEGTYEELAELVRRCPLIAE